MNQIVHAATIVKVTKDEVEVEICRQSACDACAARSLCSAGSSGVSETSGGGTGGSGGSATARQGHIMRVVNDGRDRVVGQQVEVVIERHTAGFAVAVAYLVPVVLAIGSLLILQSLDVSDLVAGLVCLGVLAAYFVTLKIFGKRLASRLEIYIR